MVDDPAFDHAGAMNAPTDTDPGPEPAGPQPSGPRVTRDEVRDLTRLRRSRADRKVAGVAAGVADHLDIDPLLVRVAFVVLTFFGGGGLVLYGACWLVVPEEDTEESVITVEDGLRTAILIIAGVLTAASLVGDSLGGFGFPWPLLVVAAAIVLFASTRDARRSRERSGQAPEEPGTYTAYRPDLPANGPTRPSRPYRGPILFFFTMALAAVLCGAIYTLELAGWDPPAAAYPATVMATCGLMLVVGAFHGRAGGLILVGLVAAGATALTVATDDYSVGQVLRTPSQADDVRSESLGLGEIVYDLTRVEDLDGLDGTTLDLETRVGRIEVIVPDEGLTVIVTADAEAAGEMKLFGDRESDHDTATHVGSDPDDSAAEDDVPVLRIDADVFLGEIEVHTQEQAA